MGIPITLLQDAHGRRFPYLRLSLTEACNFRCSYCLPEGYQAQGRASFLRVEEIARLVRALAGLGMRKVRLTGGEPSLRRDLAEVIATVAGTPGVEQVAMTTNGRLLARRAAQWRAAGLDALNVSMDSLDAARFARITGDAHFHEVREGVDAALGLGLRAVKLNAVLLRDCNDDELPAWMEYVRGRPLSVRFIELMRTGDNQAYFERHHLAPDGLEAQLRAAGWARQPRPVEAGPAREYAHPEYLGRIGFITPYARDFCASCNRLRVTARGDLRLCLFGETGVPLRHLLQDTAWPRASPA
jgi:cyclic pyranopterin phosphate synthase